MPCSRVSEQPSHDRVNDSPPVQGRTRNWLTLFWLISGLHCLACDRDRGTEGRREQQEIELASRGTFSERSHPDRILAEDSSPLSTSLPLLSIADRCMLFESGAVLDVGHPASHARERFELISDPAPLMKTVAGHKVRSFEQMHNRLIFWTSQPMTEIAFEAMVQSARSERMAAYVDGIRLGSARLSGDDPSVVRIHRTQLELAPGRHTLDLSLSRPQGGPPGADVAWLRVGSQLPARSDYPLRRSEVFSEVTLDGARSKVILVKPNGKVRCPVWLPESSRLTLGVGAWGAGRAEGEVALVDQAGERMVLTTLRKEEEDARAPQQAEVDLSPYAGQLVELEFAAFAPTDSVRVAFVEPTIRIAAASAYRSRSAPLAVVIILGSLGARHTPPRAAQHGLLALNQFRAGATFFPGYRTSSTSPTSVVASLLTGLPPQAHGISSHRQVLNSALSTLASAVEASGGRSAFFTGVPTSTAHNGFDRGFETFSASAPQDDLSATIPLERAASWLQGQNRASGPALAVVHLRGAHPPFDISREQARDLPPAEYGGEFSPRRAAIQLGAVRARSTNRQKLSDEDWIRLAEMEKAALQRQNAALVEFFEQLRRARLYEPALIVLMGDVPSSWAPSIPYDAKATLAEESLAPPLMVKFPNLQLKGKAIEGRFAPRDLTRTISGSLGLDFSTYPDAIQLDDPGASRLAQIRPHLAYRDQEYSLRVGRFVLSGRDGAPPTLCFYEIDPSCSIDRSNDHWATARALWMTVYSKLSPELHGAPRPEELEPTGDFANALIVWGLNP